MKSRIETAVPKMMLSVNLLLKKLREKQPQMSMAEIIRNNAEGE